VKRLQVFAGRERCIDLDGPIPFYHGLARARKDCPSATTAACCRLNHWRAQASIKILYQFPSASV
jgi:hypothetical protein